GVLPTEARPRKVIKVQPELVACLFGRDKRVEVESRLVKKMARPDTAFELLGAGIAHILQDIQKKKRIAASPYFPIMLDRIDELLGAEVRQEFSDRFGPFLVENYNQAALSILLAQDFPGKVGNRLYEGFVGAIAPETLGRIIVLFREHLARAKKNEGENAARPQFLAKILLRLVNTRKGKQVLSSVKVKEVIDQGEKTRKKQRLESGFKSLLQGENDALNSIELVEYLPKAVKMLSEKSDAINVDRILEAMAQHLRSGSEETQEQLIKSAITIGEYLVSRDQWQLVDILLDPLMEKVGGADAADARVEKSVILLERVMQHSWQSGENERGDTIVSLFHKIRSGQVKKTESLISMVGKIQDKGIHRASLPGLLSRCLASPADDVLRCRLISQGPVVVRFLVDSLISADEVDERMKIIDLLTENTTFLPQIILERLPAHMPWYGKRNLIKLLGDSGSEEDAESVLSYLRHEDLRVQREAFLCIYKIGGVRRKQLLLAGLKESSETVKLQIIAGLALFCDQEVAAKLSELLAENSQFSDKNRNDFIKQLLETMGRCPCEASQSGVKGFLATRGQRESKHVSQKIWDLADKTLQYIENELQEEQRKHVQAGQIRSQALRQAAKISTQGGVVPRIITGLPQEQQIRSLVAKGNKSAAIEELLDLIERTARMRNFRQAGKLREWLVEIDSNAFNRIIKASEIIEKEKAAAIDKDHIEKWSALYDHLDTAEFNNLYHALIHKKYSDGELIVSQGTLQNALFFINSGKVKLYFIEQGDEMLVNTMDQGHIFGAGVFFEASVWTLSVASVGPSEISILKLDAFQEAAGEYPRLESKLHEFCHQFEPMEQFIERSQNDRRFTERQQVTGRVTTTLLDNSGRSSGARSIVELSDISEGGLSYLARFSSRENCRALLGRRIEVLLPLGTVPGKSVRVFGDILAVKSLGGIEDDYSIHLQFTEQMKQDLMNEVIAGLRWETQAV
ncbi:MAG: cyclic nucleotide-binding domain-containing protein, partial [Desulforhopalus sp.]